MADVTTDELLRLLESACQASEIVQAFAVVSSDEDILSVRVYLADATFINVFYNLTTSKVAFAWIQERRRLFGKDNTKMGWHTHPLGNPNDHEPCPPTDFVTFLREVEEYFHGR